MGKIRFDELPTREVSATSAQQLFVDSSGHVFVATNACDSLAQQHASLKNELAMLKAEMAELRNRVAPSFKQVIPAKLYQNKPRPFNQRTQINFFLPQPVMQAALLIHDMQGNQIKKINLHQRGEGKISLQAAALKPGIYHYTLIADGQEIATRRMILTD